jgi:hypothetical protein
MPTTLFQFTVLNDHHAPELAKVLPLALTARTCQKKVVLRASWLGKRRDVTLPTFTQLPSQALLFTVSTQYS